MRSTVRIRPSPLVNPARPQDSAQEHTLSRRQLLVGALGAGALTTLARAAAAETPAPALLVPTDPTKVPGPGPSPLGARSTFESPARTFSATSSRTPLQELHGVITPADLH